MTQSESADGPETAPILLSFFCAGVPSQQATDALVTKLGVPPAEVTALRYRGDGWPGEFRVHSRSGAGPRMSYEQSWGDHLGRQLQSRCKICPDGTGGHADIAVGDFWETNPSGYPVFDDADGVSVVIARTQRGHQLLLAAAADGVLTMAASSLDDVVGVQPLQVSRRRELLGRLIGRALAGKPGPRYRGFTLWRFGAAAPRRTLRAVRGTWWRTRRERRR